MSAGRPKGYPKTGGAKKGPVHLHSKAVKDCVFNVFHDLGGERYLKKIAEQNPQLFLSLLAKLLPQETKAVSVQQVDIGAALEAAEKRRQAYLDSKEQKVISVTPKGKNYD